MLPSHWLSADFRISALLACPQGHIVDDPSVEIIGPTPPEVSAAEIAVRPPSRSSMIDDTSEGLQIIAVFLTSPGRTNPGGGGQQVMGAPKKKRVPSSSTNKKLIEGIIKNLIMICFIAR